MARRTYYPEFMRRTTDFREWLANHLDLMEQAVGIAQGSTQQEELLNLQTALNAIRPSNGWPLYKEGP